MTDFETELTGLPVGWTRAKVADVGAVRLGRQRSPDKHTGVSSSPYLRAANIKSGELDLSNVLHMDFTPEEQAIFGLQQGDIVLAEASGSATQVGRAAMWRNELPTCCYQNTVIRFRPHAVTPDYALVVFRHFSVAGIFAAAARGVGIQHLGGARFSGLPLPVPPLEEQRRIASEVQRRLADLKGGRASLESALQRTREQEREILAAAADGTLLTGSDADISDDRPASLARAAAAQVRGGLFREADEASAAPLPQGWTWETVGNVGEVRLGKQLSPAEERGPKKRPYLRVANVFEDRIDVSDVKLMHFSDEEYSTYKLQPGDILLNEGQSPELVGRPAMYRGEVDGVCFQNTLIRFRAHAFVDPDYALLVFRHYLHAGKFQRRAQWSTNIAHLGLQRFATMPFPLPPFTTQQRIAAEAGRRLKACAAQGAAIAASLDKLPSMEAEILNAAVAGALVPQNPNDESAAALLNRLGPPPSDRPTLPSTPSPMRGEQPVNKTRRASSKANITRKRSLPAVLQEAGGSLPLPDLFSQAGYDRDSTEDVEQFYLALRDALSRTIRQTNRAAENATVEVIDDATR
jgi:type I restriction enzyme S subunit